MKQLRRRWAKHWPSDYPMARPWPWTVRSAPARRAWCRPLRRPWGCAGTAVSPTFVLVQEYHGRRDVIHIDAYRLRDEDEFLSLGADEYLDSSALVLIEWAERIAGCLPLARLHIRIDDVGENTRRFTITAHGRSSNRSLQPWPRSRNWQPAE